MIDRLKIENFKCFSELSMEFRPFTLLCGVNSSGKSSVIQALLLGMEIAADKKAEGNLDLMDAKYNIDLYSFKELLYEDAEEEYIQISLYEDNVWNLWEFTSIDGDNNLLYKRKEGKEEALQKKVWYLGSERMISKYQRRGNAENLTLGKENEYIAYILECGRSLKIMIDKERSYQDQENLLFSAQVNQWLQYILPGSQVMASTTGNDNMVSLSFGKDFRFHRTNVGCGVGFVLPIIVGGLLAAKDDLLIIENPELHLHPRAQSDLALFLAFVANAGVQVLVETHSDHIINGLRKAVIGQECKIQAKEVGIYYFDKENRAEFLELDADAQFHTWPEDFMEQVEKDLYYLRKMRLANGHRDVVK